MHQDIEKLLNAAKEKGSITEQERDSIIQRAEQLHCDMAEVDLVLSKIPVMEEANMPTEESEVTTTATAEPQCLNKFNWGAFAMPGLWGLCNYTIWLLFVGILLAVVSNMIGNIESLTTYIVSQVAILSLKILFGIKGNRWAWQSGHDMTTAEKYDKRQRIWNIAGIIVFAIYAVIFIVSILKSL